MKEDRLDGKMKGAGEGKVLNSGESTAMPLKRPKQY